jgi:hypothetical protein
MASDEVVIRTSPLAIDLDASANTFRPPSCQIGVEPIRCAHRFTVRLRTDQETPPRLLTPAANESERDSQMLVVCNRTAKDCLPRISQLVVCHDGSVKAERESRCAGVSRRFDARRPGEVD